MKDIVVIPVGEIFDSSIHLSLSWIFTQDLSLSRYRWEHYPPLLQISAVTPRPSRSDFFMSVIIFLCYLFIYANTLNS